MLLLLVLLLQVFLAMQDRQIALRGKQNWYKDYYMPTPCDGLVIAGDIARGRTLVLYAAAACFTCCYSRAGGCRCCCLWLWVVGTIFCTLQVVIGVCGARANCLCCTPTSPVTSCNREQCKVMPMTTLHHFWCDVDFT
jgi:hypothetical protein